MTFYLTSALVGGLVFFGEYAVRGHLGICLGASGAVTATMVLCAFYHPKLTILFMFVIPLEVWLLVTIYVGYQVLLLFKDGHWGYAVEAHLIGAGYGYLYKRFDLRWSHLSRFRSH